ncbi:MAG: flavodoxin domain-containing protein [Candidatus Nanoarchaeia archaeon]|jgi:menaquinone-dependent protoporphyrinogen IX oxidase
MKTIIAYKTRCGSTKEYAQLLSKALKCKAFEMDSIKDLNCDRLIVMSGVYAGQMPLVSFVKSNWKKIKGKELIMIAVGLVDEHHWWSKISYFFIPHKIKKQAKYFKIIGRDPDNKEPVKKENLKRVIDYLK